MISETNREHQTEENQLLCSPESKYRQESKISQSKLMITPQSSNIKKELAKNSA